MFIDHQVFSQSSSGAMFLLSDWEDEHALNLKLSPRVGTDCEGPQMLESMVRVIPREVERFLMIKLMHFILLFF